MQSLPGSCSQPLAKQAEAELDWPRAAEVLIPGYTKSTRGLKLPFLHLGEVKKHLWMWGSERKWRYRYTWAGEEAHCAGRGCISSLINTSVSKM